MHMCYERPGLVTALNGGVGYDKWDRDRGGGGGGGGGGSSGTWAGRDRERDRERERQARAHQMSHAHAAEPDAASLFPAPFRVTGNRDRVSQQIQIKLGDYDLAQTLFDDPSKSIGICAEPASPAPCPPSRRESEFKKPVHAPQNGRVHHRPYMYNKNDGQPSAGTTSHRPPNLRIPNGFQTQNTIDSSQPPIESILKEMKSLPTPLSTIAATPRKEQENKFIFNPYTNRLVQESRQPQPNDLKTPLTKVQEAPQPQLNDLKTPLAKTGLDNRIPNARRSVSPVNKDLGLSESDDEAAATSTRLEPILSPIGSGGSPSSGSESSQSDSETESSSAESSTAAPIEPRPASAPAPVVAPLPRTSSWSLSNFAPPPAHPPDQPYDSSKEHDVRHALADVKGKPSPISELSDSEASSPSPGVRRRRSIANRSSAVSSDEDTPRSHNTSSPRLASAPATQKRGRPPNKTAEPPKKKRGRPRKQRAQSPPAAPSPRLPDSDPEPEPAPAPVPPPNHVLQDTKTHIFRKVFTPKKGDEGGGKGGKGGKGKGGKGKGQVTIIEVTAPESGADDEDRRRRERSAERRREEALARVSPPMETDNRRREDRGSDRLHDRVSIERSDHRRSDERPPDRPTDRIQTERTSNDRIPSNDRLNRMSNSDRIQTDRLSGLTSDRLTADRIPSDRMVSDRLPSDRASDRLITDRLLSDRHSSDRLSSGLSDRLSSGSDRRSSERLSNDKSLDRLSDDKTSLDRLSVDKLSHDKSGRGDKMAVDRLDRIVPERYVRAEADVGSGLKSGRGSERLEEASSNVSERRRGGRVVVRVPLSRLRPDTVRRLRQRRAAAPPQPAPPSPPHHQGGEVAATNHERSPGEGQTPIYYSYFERLPADALSDEERDHKYYLGEAKRLRTAAEREQEPLQRVMLYLESVLCFVLTGRVLELELDTKRAFTIYRETIEYIKSIHSMPQRFRASPHSTFNKLDILSLRVQALLYLRMFKMYNREVKEYYKIVQDYQQKVNNPACSESVSPMSPTPSPAGSVGSVGSAASASSGYCSVAHSVPGHAHNALLQLTKYYTFLYVAHELWEQADCLCRLRANQDLFIAVDRKCGPLTLFSTFRHLVQYVRYAISLLKNAPRE